LLWVAEERSTRAPARLHAGRITSSRVGVATDREPARRGTQPSGGRTAAAAPGAVAARGRALDRGGEPCGAGVAVRAGRSGGPGVDGEGDRRTRRSGTRGAGPAVPVRRRLAGLRGATV